MKIRATALILVPYKKNLLVYPGYDKKTDEMFYRPIGGGIEFGESGSAAALREFREETGLEVCRPRRLGFLENIFNYRGRAGHEIVQVFLCDFADKKNYRQKSFSLVEGDRVLEDARWVPLENLLDAKTSFYPAGIKALVRGI